jgi:hypothetical protein
MGVVWDTELTWIFVRDIQLSASHLSEEPCPEKWWILDLYFKGNWIYYLVEETPSPRQSQKATEMSLGKD